MEKTTPWGSMISMALIPYHLITLSPYYHITLLAFALCKRQKCRSNPRSHDGKADGKPSYFTVDQSEPK